MTTITYSTPEDAIYVKFAEAREDNTWPPAARTVPLDDNRIVDYDEEGKVIGLELLGVSHGIDFEGLPERERLEKELSGLRVALGAGAA